MARKNRKINKKNTKEASRHTRQKTSKAKRPPRDTEDPPASSAHGARRVHEAFGILTLAVALLLGPSLASAQFGEGTLMGPLGHILGNWLNEFLGLSGYLVVIVLCIVAVRIFAYGLGLGRRGDSPLTLWRERLGMILATLFLSMLLHLFFRPDRIGDASFGGLIGEIAAEILCSLVYSPGAWVLGLAGLALSIVLATNLSWARTGLAIWKTARRGLASMPPLVQRGKLRFKAFAASIACILRRQDLSACEADGTAALPPPVVRLDFSSAAAEMIQPVIEPTPYSSDFMPVDLEIGPPASSTPSLPDLLERPPRIIEPIAEEKPPKKRDKKRKQQPSDPEAADNAAAEETPAGDTAAQELTIVKPQYDTPLADIDEEEGTSEEKKVEPTDGPGFKLNSDVYRPPPISLLEYEPNEETSIDKTAIEQQAELLVKTLADYKIRGRIQKVHPGPVVTMYEFVPAPGTRISKVAGLANDLAMSLAAQRVRIVAPLPGKGAIGIEVPNEQRSTVYFKEIVAHDAFRGNKSKLTLAMGKNIVGAPVTLDLSKMPHLLVAGATGAGKSVSINAMICSLLLKSSPEEVRMIMVDPKYLELSGYNDIPHLLLPVVTDPAKANIALRWAVREMERRYQLLADMHVRDIKSYNRKVDKLRGAEIEAQQEELPGITSINEASPSKILVVRKNSDGSEEVIGDIPKPETGKTEASQEPVEQGGEDDPPKKKKGPLPRRLPYIVVVIDEFADLMMVASKDVESSVARLAQKARAAGIHVILATQRPSVDVITGLIKANFPSRVSFQVASGHDSKTILNSQGAENLLGAGDMLVLDRGSDLKRLHGAYISDPEIRKIVDWLKEQGRPIYDMDILKPEEEDDPGFEPDEYVDEMYDQAVALVAETRQASISMIQRRLRVGYNRAARMVERMEREGVVGPADGVKGREVLIDPH